MKKTLAAVLAAAMALSTATVALAVDQLIDEEDRILVSGNTQSAAEEIRYGKGVNRIINELGDFGEAELAQLVEEGKIQVSVIMTTGSNKLDGKPSISVVKRANSSTQSDATPGYYWADNITVNGKVVCKKGSKVGDLPVVRTANDADWDGNVDGMTDVEFRWLDESHSDYLNIRNWLVTNGQIEKRTDLKDTTIPGGKALQLKFTVKDTYSTGTDTVGMKLRITIKRSFTSDVSGESYTKGNTYTSEEFKYEAKYFELAQYAHDMQLTGQEVEDRYVLLNGSNLYDQIGNDTFRITFGDTAVFEGKGAAAQKKVNLFYNVNEVEAVVDQYPDADFEFITFKGKAADTSFVNTGKMTFNAIGGKNTQVYYYDGEALEPLTGKHDSTYNTITVSGIKRLSGTFVVSSDILEDFNEPEEPSEPVDSTPVAEPDDEGENPNTGAC